MKRQSSLTRTGTPSSRALPVVGSLLAGLVMVLAFSIAVVGCASDTNGTYPTGTRGAQMAPPGPSVYEIITQLELEPEQLPAVRAVLEDAEEERDEILVSLSGAEGRPDPSAMADVRTRMDDLNQRTEDRLEEVLTSDQMVEYHEMIRKAEQQHEQMRSQMDGGRGGGGGRRPGGKG